MGPPDPLGDLPRGDIEDAPARAAAVVGAAGVGGGQGVAVDKARCPGMGDRGAQAVEGGVVGEDPEAAVLAEAVEVIGLAVAHEIDGQEGVGIPGVKIRRQDRAVALERGDVAGAGGVGVEVGVVAEEHAPRVVRRVGHGQRRRRAVVGLFRPTDAVDIVLLEEPEAIGAERLVGPVLRRVGVDDVAARILGQLVLIAREGEVGIGDALEEAPQHRLGDAHARSRVVAGARQHARVHDGRALPPRELRGDLGGSHHGCRGVEEDEDVGFGRAFAEEVAVVGGGGRRDERHHDGRDHPASGRLSLHRCPLSNNSAPEHRFQHRPVGPSHPGRWSPG